MTQHHPGFRPPPFQPASHRSGAGRKLIGTVEVCDDMARLILDEADELASSWPSVRDDPAREALAAREVLAVWAHLRRFPPEVAAAAPAQRLNQLVTEDRERLVSQLLSLTPGGCQQAAIILGNAWDAAAPAALEGLERQTRELFDELDRNSLAAHAASLLLPEDDSLRQRLNQFREVALADEDFLAENPHLFLHASPLASALLRAYRTDLDESDESLWLTTIKHHVLEQLSGPAPDGLLGRPGAEDAADLKDSFRV